MRTKRLSRCGVLVTLIGLAAGSSGCSTMNNTEKGVGLGGLVGAGLGTAVGAATGNPKTGAVVGGLVGAGVGGAVGNDIDRQDQQKREIRQATAIANAQAQPKMGMMDVVQMVQAGHDQQVIINQISNSGSTFQLSAADLDYLKTYNVPPMVIIEMQNAKPQPVLVRQRPVVVHEPATVIYESPPPVWVVGPRPVYVGGGYYRRW
jgi:hypothetical protein